MYANKFAEGYANMRLEEGHRKVSRTPSPRDVAGSCSSQQAVCADGAGAAADCLANRISFYMDDAVISSTDEVRDVSPALSRQASSRQRGLFPSPRAAAAAVAGSSPAAPHARRSRSFRLEGREEVPRPRLYRHGSDIGPGGARRSSTRSKRSGSGRRSAGGGGSASGGATPERGGSVRHHHHHHHHHRSGSARRKASSASRLSVGLAAAPPRGAPGFPLPHADLPPKERRRRLVVLIVVVTFMFLVVCSVLTVVVTLTHSSFQKSPDTVNYERPGNNQTVRKENEEMMSAAISKVGIYNNSAASSTPLEVSSTPDP